MIAAALLALAWTTDARADGAVQINSCQTLSSQNTTYRLTADLTSDGDCMIVAADRITIDLQGHSITGTTGGSGITDAFQPHDLIVIKNGTISHYDFAISLASSRVSVLAINAMQNNVTGIVLFGAHSLVKSSNASFNQVAGVFGAGFIQIQQTTANNNNADGINVGGNCLVTMNTANYNGNKGISVSEKCTVSYNTTNGNDLNGISALVRSLITHNTALNNPLGDFLVFCPSDVTFNESTNGFPDSYTLDGNGCKTNGNE